MRISKTEFISCPSCGRTLFNLQDTTKKIQDRTGHLPGVRIAVMGCIVNGPGEMADADFGYVGSGPGKVDLYVSYDCVRRGIPSGEAVDELVDLVKEHGRWQEPPQAEDASLSLGLDLIREQDTGAGNKANATKGHHVMQAVAARAHRESGPDGLTLGSDIVRDSL